ncbi:S-layer homology domain-containing protein [Sedimentibacter hydroxybenzoicus DSM 7310]|uniref:S-layer homology domain-containing protein n=1 Tax=Sedimentibacter hydroxybenzoicus DSM 7310 TaxID=1123245 RepID=A0A974BHU8_SEDHY|nr:S-layer homology domain-containing protein [Sedimentibacter hydroxybenzoicus]NYB73201.1 S-layer homology domain-containing protein [Sedimentibacter hydroxybenzoicus DSM 7310]
MKQKFMFRRVMAAVMTVVMFFTLFPASAFAYVGAMRRDVGGIAVGSKDGYYYLQNSYIGFYIRLQDGNMITVPSQKTLEDVKKMGATETYSFYAQTFTGGEIDPIKTDVSQPIYPRSKGATIIQDAENPKLSQNFLFDNGTRIDITYELVRLDKGAQTGNNGKIIEYDDSDSGRTWGVLAQVKISNAPKNTSIRVITRHNGFGSVGHNIAGSPRMGFYTHTYDYPSDKTTRTHYSSLLYPTSDAIKPVQGERYISEVYTDSFSYANQFVALGGYVNIMGEAWDGHGNWIPTLHSGIRGHLHSGIRGYAHSFHYSPVNSTVSVNHDFGFDESSWALWGFRDLYEFGATNIPPDPATIPTNAACLGIVKNANAFSAQPGENETELKTRYGSNLVAVFRGTFEQSSGNFVFKNGAVQLSPSLTATWDGSGEFIVASNGSVTAKNVHLSTPTFKCYKPNTAPDSSLKFSYTDGKLKIEMEPDKNAAIIHIDIPGARCRLESVTADMLGNLIFTGDMGISTPFIDAAKIEMKRLGMGTKNSAFVINGVEASGSIDTEKLMGLEIGSASAEINTFEGEERYAFELEVNVFDLFEAEGELELTRIYTGALIPNTLILGASSEVGVPLVPPIVVGEFNGLRGGFKDLAKTINGDYSAIPPLRLTVGAKGSVLEIIEGWYDITVGAGYYEAKLSDGKIFEMEIIDEYSWYVGLGGDVRKYSNKEYKGLSVNGGMKLDVAITKDKPFIRAGGAINASAFSGISNDGKNMYVMLGADGKIYGMVQIPEEAWALGDMTLMSAQIDLALGGQTEFSIANTTVEEAAKNAFRNISGYGGVAYTGTFVGLPFRIYYIFQDKNVGIKVGAWWEKFEPFNPGPYKQALLNESTGEQTGILVMNDNFVLLASSRPDIMGISGSTTPSGITAKSAYASGITGVDINEIGTTGKKYEVEISDSVDPNLLAVSLILKNGSGATSEELFEDIKNKITNPDYTTFSAIRAKFNSDGEITNEGTANTFLGENYVTVKLPVGGTWTFDSSGEPFDIVCYYASPYASLDNMSINADGKMTGQVEDMDSSASYILRTYLGDEKGATDYLLSQSDVPVNGEINESIPLIGGAVPTGSYYVTTVLLEEINDDFDGNKAVDEDEIAFIRTHAYEFDNMVDYNNDIQPKKPLNVGLKSIGSEVMRASWKKPAGDPVDGYYIRLYQKDGSKWISTGANYLLKSDDLDENAGGEYTLDMAVTAGNGDDTLSPLEADKDYKIGITAFKYIDGNFPVESEEAESFECRLPKAVFPKLTYLPEPFVESENSMKLFYINGSSLLQINSFVNGNWTPTRMVVARMDTDAVIAETDGVDDMSPMLSFYTPEDFEGALNLMVTATSAQGDITVDYIGLRLDDVPPMITLDSDSFVANYNTGEFSITGATESNAAVVLATPVITADGTNGVSIDNLSNDQIKADENGAFTLKGHLNPASNNFTAADSGVIILQAKDAAGNASEAASAQIVRGGKSQGSGPTGAAAPAVSGIVIAPEESPVHPVTVVIPVENKNIEDKDISDAIAKAQLYAKEHGKTANGISVVLDMGDLMSVTLSRTALNSLVSAGVTELAINGTNVSLGLDLKALKEILNQSSGDVTITIAPATGLSEQAQSLIGNRPVYNVTISYFSDRKIVNVSSLGNGTATLSIHYTPGENEAVGYLFGVYVDEEGNVSRIPGSTYDNDSRCLIITTDHLSLYGVGYTKPSAKFTDIGSHWAEEYIDYAVGRGLLSGTSDTFFAPETAMTRGMLVTVLGRTVSVDDDEYTASSFTDVPADKYYMPYVEWAYKNDIVRGTGNQQFAPDRAVTREEIAVIFANYAKAVGYRLPMVREVIAYADDSSIGIVYKDAITEMQQSGVMTGDNRNMFNPKSSATRAEVSVMLYRYIKLTINPATAQGWTLNDAGQYYYYRDGKALSGWHDIDGARYFFNDDYTLKTGWVKDGEVWRYYFDNQILTGWQDIGDKWYYFYDDGSLARNATIDGYNLDENGVRKTK